jgi:hypothetical protein
MAGLVWVRPFSLEFYVYFRNFLLSHGVATRCGCTNTQVVRCDRAAKPRRAIYGCKLPTAIQAIAGRLTTSAINA